MIGHSIVPHLHLGNNDNIATSHYNETEVDNSVTHFLSLIFSNELGEKHLEHVRSESIDTQVPDAPIQLFFIAAIALTLHHFNCVSIDELVYYNTVDNTKIYTRYFANLLGNYSFTSPPLV